jgi:hypothetical protein
MSTTAALLPVYRAVLAVIAASDDGITDNEIGLALNLTRKAAADRRNKLQRLGLVAACGARDTGARHKATLWRAANG